jgi:hypothetical protein
VSAAAPGTAPAVLVLACRRPEFTERLLKFLVAAGVRDIHVAVDGPKSNERDARLVARTRDVVHSFELPKDQLLLRDANMGGPKGVPEAIDWFFRARERGIILEDDLLPDPSFIRFAGELLERYENEPRVGWGWATWASRWKDFDREARLWFDVDHERVLREASGGDAAFMDYWTRVLKQIYDGGARNWDYRWLFTNFVHRRLTATASVNLVENTGVGEDSQNMKTDLFFLLPKQAMAFPLRHPTEIQADVRADRHTQRAVYLWTRWMRIRYRLAAALS